MATTIELSPQAQLVRRWLDERGMEYEYVDAFPVGEIDMERSLKNQARLVHPIDEAIVEQYAADMADGDEFPPIVLWPGSPRNGHVLVSGIHRTLAALTASRETLPAFVLKTDNKTQVSVLTYEANTTHGKATTLAERSQQALFLVDSGLSTPDAARLLHIDKKTLSRLAQIRRGRERLAAQGFKRLDRWADFTVQRLESLRADEVLKAAGQLVQDAGLNTEQVNELIVQANKLRSDADQLKLIEEERKRLAPMISAKMGGKIRLAKSVSRVASVTGATAKLAIPLKKDLTPVPDAYKRDLIARVEQAQARLREISKALKA